MDISKQVDSTDAEESVIAFMIQSAKKAPENLDKILGILKPADFEGSPYRITYEAIRGLLKSGTAVELATLKIALEQAGKLTDIGGIASLRLWAAGGLLAQDISEQSAWAMVQQVLERSRRRVAIESGLALVTLARDLTVGVGELVKRAEVIMLAMALNTTGDSEGEAIGGLMDKAIAEIEANRKAVANGGTAGIASTLADLSKEIGGYQAGQLITIAGRPGSGKSAFAMQEAVGIAKQGLPVLIFSLEMNGESLATRVLGSESRVSLTNIRDGRVTDAELDKLAETARKSQDLPITIYSHTQNDLPRIASAARRMKARSGDGRLGGVFIDYLQLLDYDNAFENIELGKVTKALKRLASELECPIFIASQLNRGVEARQDKRPVASDLRGSGSIEQDSSLILMLYRDDMYSNGRDTPPTNIAEISIAKQRSGPRGAIVKTYYDAPTTTFRNLAPQRQGGL
jgi:replicative DNA helicase